MNRWTMVSNLDGTSKLVCAQLSRRFNALNGKYCSYLASAGEVELFCTRAGHKTGFHFDFQENLTLQLAGRYGVEGVC